MVNNYINRRLPYGLSFRSSATGGPYTDQFNAYDFAFGGIPFLSAATNDRPLIRRTGQFKRDQFDNSPEPGEQSLTGWWLRSQSSFHLGAGLRFEDATEETNRFRFEKSEGVDVWTPGEVSLLPTTTLRRSASGVSLCHGAIDGTTDIVLATDGSTLYRVTASASASVTWGGTGSILSLTDDGTNYLAANATSIYRGTLAGGAGAALWNTGSSSVTIQWAKQRLMAGIANKIYELTGTGPTLPTATYTHPNTAWVWTCISEGPEAVYASGYAGARSVVLKIALDTQGALPALTNATTVAEMPTGEIVHAIYGYLGTFLVLGTSRGVRVAQIGSGGVLDVGPLIETPSPVKALTGQDRYIYAAYSNGFTDGTSGLLRIDLGAQLPTGRYAYTSDLRAHVSGNVGGVTQRGASGTLAFSVDTHGLYEASTDVEPTGFIRTNRIRFSTLWPKIYKQLSLRTSPPYVGTIAVSTIDQADTEVSLITASPDLDTTSDIAVNYPATPQQFLALKFQLERSASSDSTSPVFNGYQLKAVPGGPRPRQFVIPLYCFDFEKDRTGTSDGYDGRALARLKGMEELDSMGDTVLMQDLIGGEAITVLIEGLEFTQTSPPEGDAWGGILQVTCRSVTV